MRYLDFMQVLGLPGFPATLGYNAQQQTRGLST